MSDKRDKLFENTENIEGWNMEASYQQLPTKLFSRVQPTPVKDPKIVVYNEDLGNRLGIKVKNINPESASVFSGNQVPTGALPIAQAYAGHQFGHFTLLGDGRAILLGEQITPEGERYDIQLKGSGPTPYSRRGDGRAALGPMLREYIISEAMFALGIPSTRALAVVVTGERILRETRLPGAILTRVALSHLRVGTFEYANQFGSKEDLKALADYTIERHFPDIIGEDYKELYEDLDQSGGVKEENIKYVRFFEAVADKQAELIAKWQLVGFVHGVMNTDNMALSGETIDYGPCAFMDTYDPNTVFSSIDQRGRYAYQNQPQIGQWNLARLAESLLPLIHEDQSRGVKLMEGLLQNFSAKTEEYRLRGMGKKLGIFQISTDDEKLIGELLQIMQKNREDYTNTFFALTYKAERNLKMKEDQEFLAWKKKWEDRLQEQQAGKEEVEKLMKATNPVVIPRNHQVERALNAAVTNEDYSVMKTLMKILYDPYRFSQEKKPYQEPPGPSDPPYVTYCGT